MANVIYFHLDGGANCMYGNVEEEGAPECEKPPAGIPTAA